MELSAEARSVIDEYMQSKTPLALGYESHGIKTFADVCRDFFDGFNWQRILKIKNDCCQYSKKKEFDYYKSLDEKSKHYFDNQWKFRFVWSKPRGFLGTQNDYTETTVMRYFTNNIMNYVNPYIEMTYGTLEKAINSTESFVELWNGFAIWFDLKRKNFMKKMELDLSKMTEVTKRKTPQSHGGVANLLKILTKTMMTQGADITSIAKVQYAVCTQAGIYIPDEFIRDVAVAMDISDEVADDN